MIDRPPTLRELAGDPVYRTYLRTPPRLPESLRWGFPWRLWVERSHTPYETRWLTKKYHTYTEAWNKAVAVLRHPETIDVCIVSIRHFFDPPIVHTQKLRNKKTKRVIIRQIYWLPEPQFDWCFRCRRPSTFTMLPSDHHALRTQAVVSPESPYRCYFCGIRRAGMPSARHYNFQEST
jgi:hypothetical protein